MRKIDLVKLKNVIKSNKKLDGFDAEVLYSTITNSSRLYLSCLNKIYNMYTHFATIYENGTIDVFNECCDLVLEEAICENIVSNIEQAIENAESFFEDVRNVIGGNKWEQ